ncbi:MAG: hypothetical protein FD144_5895, partial [Rhodospirillaceae bacterium]
MIRYRSAARLLDVGAEYSNHNGVSGGRQFRDVRSGSRLCENTIDDTILLRICRRNGWRVLS